jgi:hypothetical protein
MSLLLGGFVARLSTSDLKADIRRGREWLVQIAHGEDFGYDALRWHEYLWATDAGGYKWSRRSPDKWARHVIAEMARPGWTEAVRELEAQDQRQREPAVSADAAAMTAFRVRRDFGPPRC